LREEGSQQKLNATGCTHHPPTVKNFHAGEQPGLRLECVIEFSIENEGTGACTGL